MAHTTPRLASSTARPNRSQRSSNGVTSIIGLLLAACCFWQGLPALSSLWQGDAQANIVVEAPQRQLVRTKIKDLRPGRRVIAGNPELGEALADSDIDPATWRLITLAMSKPDGGRLDIELLRPVEWIADFEAEVGRTVDLDLAELGAAGPAEVLSIAPCPEIEPDDGTARRVITGTFRHSSGNIYDIQIAGEPAPIGTTGNHPFWSEDRHAFVPAETLQPGEHLRQANGTTTTVVSLTRSPTTEPVYNLEVDVDHVYHVGIGGVLVHNACQIKHIVYQAKDPTTGKIYTGITSGSGSIQSILKRRFSNHHTGLTYEDVVRSFAVSSRASARGLEDLMYARMKIKGNAFWQNRPVSDRNGNLMNYLKAALDDIAAGNVSF